MSNKRFGCLWVALLLVLCLSLVINVALVTSRGKISGELRTRTLKPQRLEERVLRAGASGSRDRIVVIPVRGVISASVSGRMTASMVEDIKLQLRQAEEDKLVKAVVLAIDSPGGEVTASDILYNAVRRVRATKPVVVSMGSMATSGGYYIACGGKYLMANPTTFTGSIGVIIQSLRYNDLLNKIGVAPVTFKSGAFKDMLSGTREMTEEEKAYIQKLVMQTYGVFVGVVARERHIPEETLRAGIADGRVVSGTDALDAKLIDGLGEIEDAYQKAKDLAKAPGAAVVAYEAQFSFSRIFQYLGGEAESSSGKVEVNLTQKLLPTLEPGRAYWLPGFYGM
ncbi:MAG: signal peptide peptidase SppA [Chthoniobacteraceae bacterium]|nr:signal peptide peptidase SppA [Chthoniobacteraceae bacterium]